MDLQAVGADRCPARRPTPADPCPTCPWRLASTVGGSDIPAFDIDKMRGLRCTVGRGDEFRPIMACHYSPEGDEHACVGYIAQHGYSNIAVRMALIEGRINPDALAAGERHELWPDFWSMLEAYEAASLGSPEVE